MAEQESDQEPTMEEILASIRRIISEDDEESAEEAPAEEAPEPVEEEEPEPVQTESAEPEGEGEVLELTQKVNEDGSVTDLAPEEEAEEPVAEEPVAEEPVAEEPAEDFDDVVVVNEGTDSGLMSQDAAGAASASFSDLARTLVVTAGEGQTIEAMLLDLLRPLLTEWFNQHLPPLVEDIVKDEIQRVARRRAQT